MRSQPEVERERSERKGNGCLAGRIRVNEDFWSEHFDNAAFLITSECTLYRETSVRRGYVDARAESSSTLSIEAHKTSRS